MLKDRVLLITGGTGSFGHAVVTRFMHSDAALLVAHDSARPAASEFRRKGLEPYNGNRFGLAMAIVAQSRKHGERFE